MVRAQSWLALWLLAAAPAAAQISAPSPDVLTTIQGSAVDSSDHALPGAPLRLRNARLGGIVSRIAADANGRFRFSALDPGSYVIELTNDQGRVVASSQLLNVDAGDVVSTIVKLPNQKPPLGGLLGPTLGSAVAVAAAAATSGVLAATVTGDPSSP
jgi:Carboxypeptidase regulatory-like domain